ncbi:MAG: hypothetical protein DBW67_06685 [SAR116 cluster bacterium]|nr:MAG: hypothetical protein DBW67_06685 [SAR116 cluster bacterium]
MEDGFTGYFFGLSERLWTGLSQTVLMPVFASMSAMLLLVMLIMTAFGRGVLVAPVAYRFALSILLLTPVPGSILPLGAELLRQLLDASTTIAQAVQTQQMQLPSNQPNIANALAAVEAEMETRKALLVEACLILAPRPEYCGGPAAVYADILTLDAATNVASDIKNFVATPAQSLAAMVAFEQKSDPQFLANLLVDAQAQTAASLTLRRNNIHAEPLGNDFGNWFSYPMVRFGEILTRGQQIFREVAVRPSWPNLHESNLLNAGLSRDQANRLLAMMDALDAGQQQAPMLHADAFGTWVAVLRERNDDDGPGIRAALLNQILREVGEGNGTSNFVVRAGRIGSLMMAVSSDWLTGVGAGNWLSDAGFGATGRALGASSIRVFGSDQGAQLGASLALLLPDKAWAVTLGVVGAFVAYAIPLALQLAWATLTLMMFLAIVKILVLAPILPIYPSVGDTILKLISFVALAPPAMMLGLELFLLVSIFVDDAILLPISYLLPSIGSPVAVGLLLIMTFALQFRFILALLARTTNFLR